jgi:hypothetical protein
VFRGVQLQGLGVGVGFRGCSHSAVLMRLTRLRVTAALTHAVGVALLCTNTMIVVSQAYLGSRMLRLVCGR